MRALLIAIGLLALALGLLGLLLPLLPTTPFLLLAAACFSRASTRLHAWLLRLPVAGRMLADYERCGGLSPRSRRSALLLVWGGIGVSVIVFAYSPWRVAMLLAIAFALTIVIARLPGLEPAA